MSIHSALQLLFLVSEIGLLLFKRSKKIGTEKSGDKRSLLILWIVIVSCMIIGPFLSEYHIWSASDKHLVVYTGTVVTIIGFIIRWIAIIQLGKMFTVDVAIANEHTLKTSGIYKIVRHPSYLGLIIIIAGLSICMNSVLCFLIMFVPAFIAINYRIKVEEEALTQEFGARYTTYKASVKKIIPGIY